MIDLNPLFWSGGSEEIIVMIKSELAEMGQWFSTRQVI